MSILGYSAAYFLPEYWSNTPFYGEKIIPLLDYVLSTDFEQADKLANAFYMMENKYKNTADLPLDAIKEIINESGYSYVLDLLGQDESSVRLLVYLLVLIHQLKGTQLGIEVVLNILKKSSNDLKMKPVGNIIIADGVASGFTTSDYVIYNGFTVDSNPFEFTLRIKTPSSFTGEQAIISCNKYGFYLGFNADGMLVLSLGSDGSTWNIANRVLSKIQLGGLKTNTNYYIKFVYDTFGYTVKCSEITDSTVTAGKARYTDYIEVKKADPILVHAGTIYVGVDGSSGEIASPYQGSIDLKPFSTNIGNVSIKQWFEYFPVGEENTFTVNADLDLGIVSTDFFDKFAVFVSKYVYPTLEEFEARLSFTNNLTFIPYVRQRINYVALGDVLGRSFYRVKDASDPTLMKNFTVVGNSGTRLDFEVVDETLTINPVPVDATVILRVNNIDYPLRSIDVSYGTVVNYTVSADGYVTKTETVTVTTTEEITVALEASN